MTVHSCFMYWWVTKDETENIYRQVIKAIFPLQHHFNYAHGRYSASHTATALL